METEIMQSVFNEVLEELKEVKLQQLEQTKSLTQLIKEVGNLEKMIPDAKVASPAIDTTPIPLLVADGINKLKTTIEAQPKSITRQFRLLLFPENYAETYYKIVFGRLFFWMIIFLFGTYLLHLEKNL